MVGFAAVPVGNDDDEYNELESRRWRGRKGVMGPSWAKFPLLTIGLLGAQIVWSTEMGYASPYLLSLGLSKSSMSIVFVAGPLSGLFVQPLIGVLADNSTSRFGRRRPYMLVGAVICALSMLVLGFTKDVASWFLPSESSANATLTVWLAVLSIYFIDFSINAVQAADRALLVDTLPPSQQERVNAWAGRMLSVGSVIGYLVGNLPLPSILPFLGRTQLQVLAALSAFLLLGTHGLTCVTVSERILLPQTDSIHTVLPEASGSGFRTYAPTVKYSSPLLIPFRPLITLFRFSMAMVKDIWDNVKILPPNIQQICLIQFFSWIGWFPVLFFTTVWVGEIYTLSLTDTQIQTIVTSGKDGDGASKLTEEATLVGFGALLWSSILGLITIIILPLVVAFFEKRHARLHATHHLHGAHSYGFLGRLHVTLADIWTFSLSLFAGCMFATGFTTNDVWASTVVIALTGFCFSVSMWVPFALLGEEISGANQSKSGGSDYHAIPGEEGHESETIPLSRPRRSADEEMVFDAGGEGRRNDPDERTLVENDGHMNGGNDNRHPEEEEQDASALMKDLERSEFVENDEEGVHEGGSRSGRNRGKGGIADKAGIILGIHNVAVVVPQFLVTGLSSIIFAFFDDGVTGIHPGAGHAGAGVGPGGAAGAISDSSDPSSVIPSPTVVGTNPDPDIGFDEKGGGLYPMDDDRLARFARRAGKIVGKAAGRALRRTYMKREAEVGVGGSPDGIGLIFKIGGVCSLIAAALCWKLARDLRRG